MRNKKADIFDTFGDDAQNEFFERIVEFLMLQKKRDHNYIMTNLRKAVVETMNDNPDFVNVVNFKTLPSSRRQELVNQAVTKLLDRLELNTAENIEQIQKIYVEWKERHNRQ